MYLLSYVSAKLAIIILNLKSITSHWPGPVIAIWIYVLITVVCVEKSALAVVFL
jgi:hypothetical protein